MDLAFVVFPLQFCLPSATTVATAAAATFATCATSTTVAAWLLLAPFRWAYGLIVAVDRTVPALLIVSRALIVWPVTDVASHADGVIFTDIKLRTATVVADGSTPGCV